MTRKVSKTKKSKDGDILALCHSSEWWSPRSKEDAIRDIESVGNTNSPYYTEVGSQKVLIHVIRDQIKGKYLRTDPDKTTKNNLSELPDC
ncbi:DUF3892 domain-containing protein [Leptospira sp. 85282-16]|uniref:DUF3892 domain-containing protein n=1 Tax=Leptospira sp. 85282-16 TaxID=2971256 RepID=UPI0021BECECD|nr:DUF3892 domain-containing protein [Leptospira sp. 85282-16]MCT8335193.1 DUF3892 domain-containing protein [Leptospira sp. 85282-16]